ncbi:MAG: FAD-dependent thymidylate synthase [Bacilli bacterium]|nr:FAD-dependent thymidylate synthase [Bacilli bacterium]
MKLVKPYVRYVQNKDNFEHIAKAARICYASEAKGHNDYEFVENLWNKRNHRSPYRHGTS